MATSRIIKTLKLELKKNKITYLDLAKQLGITEAGVKKILNKSDISLKKIEAICSALNISLTELFKLAENEDIDSVRFTDEQIDFFLNRPHFFHFFMKLAYEQKKPKEIQNEFQLSTKSLSLYLKRLEELNLIKRHPNDHNQIIGGIPLAVSTKGTPLENFKYDVALQLLKTQNAKNNLILKGAGLYLTENEKEIFTEKIESIILEYSDISRSNRKRTRRPELSELTFMSYTTNSSMFTKIVEL